MNKYYYYIIIINIISIILYIYIIISFLSIKQSYWLTLLEVKYLIFIKLLINLFFYRFFDINSIEQYSTIIIYEKICNLS